LKDWIGLNWTGLVKRGLGKHYLIERSKIFVLTIKITISPIVIGLKHSYFSLVHLPSCYRTVCYWIVCHTLTVQIWLTARSSPGTSCMKARLVRLPEKCCFVVVDLVYFISLCLRVAVVSNATRRDRALPRFTSQA